MDGYTGADLLHDLQALGLGYESEKRPLADVTAERLRTAVFSDRRVTQTHVAELMGKKYRSFSNRIAHGLDSATCDADWCALFVNAVTMAHAEKGIHEICGESDQYAKGLKRWEDVHRQMLLRALKSTPAREMGQEALRVKNELWRDPLDSVREAEFELTPSDTAHIGRAVLVALSGGDYDARVREAAHYLLKLCDLAELGIISQNEIKTATYRLGTELQAVKETGISL